MFSISGVSSLRLLLLLLNVELRVTVQVCGIDQLWGIALRAQNTDVSLNAIQCLNNHYINCKWSYTCSQTIYFRGHFVLNSFIVSTHCLLLQLIQIGFTRMVLLFWCRLTQFVLEKRPLNECSCSKVKVRVISV